MSAELGEMGDKPRDDSDQKPEIDRGGRETWKGQFDFLMTLIGFSVGVGNIWRFPYLCYKNGGGVFFIPYLIALFGAGVPILFLEVSLGQFTCSSGVPSWRIFPLAKGIGVATTFIVFNLNMYYIIVITWAIYYLYSCFTFGDLPWTVCREEYGDVCNVSTTANSSLDAAKNNYVELFWSRHVLGLSSGLESIGSIQPHMAISLLVAWLLVYACIIKGVQWTGKIVWFTGLFPYFMLVVLFVRGITLQGAFNGIKFYLTPQFSKLYEGTVWLDAGTQVFFSMSLGLGAMQTLGSYNKFHHNCLRDCLLYAVVNSCTSIFGGFCIFSVLGYMAHEMGVPVSEVTLGGPGLTFIAYPKALSLMPTMSKLLSIMFFLMLIFLGLDSQFVGVEGFTSQFMDAFPTLFNFRHSRAVFITAVCSLYYLMGLLMVTEGGMYIFQIMDFYSASGLVLLFVCFCESAAIAYCYGSKRFLEDLEHMLKRKIPLYFPVCWNLITPLTCASIAAIFMINVAPLQYGAYVYPKWTAALGWTITSCTCLTIPIMAVFQVITHLDEPKDLITAEYKLHQIHEKTKKPFKLEECALDNPGVAMHYSVVLDSNNIVFD